MAPIQTAIAKIRSIGDEYCENQVYIFPDYDPHQDDATALCKRLCIPFTDDLMVRYPAKRTFCPILRAKIDANEASLGITLPEDYKKLLETFGEFHLPGKASVCLKSPLNALEATRCAWCYEGKPLTVLAISSYNNTSDGNSIGYIRDGNLFRPELFEFKHELLYGNDDPSLWTRKVGESLADFLITYLETTDRQ